MDFFGDLGGKISKAGQSAVQKAKDMTDVARINGLIADEEKQLNNNYYQIGKLYARLHKDDCESEFAALITAVCNSETKIAEYRKQIGDIKGVIWCEKCGAEIPSNAAFCSSCGAPASKPAVEDNTKTIKCATCGAMLNENMRFCTCCGQKITEQVTDETASNVEQQMEEQVANKCPNCGAEIPEGNVFCTECGTKLD